MSTETRSIPARVVTTAPSRLSLRELDDVLSSDEHFQATPTRNYGPHDPVLDAVEFICACPCGAGPGHLVFDYPSTEQLVRQGGGLPGEPKRRHFVECHACRQRGRSTVHDWAAVIEWNREHYDARFPVERFPFFDLGGLGVVAAQAEINAIRRDLELRKSQAKRRSAEGIETGKRYRERLEAYLGWAIAAASLLKAHARVKAGIDLRAGER